MGGWSPHIGRQGFWNLRTQFSPLCCLDKWLANRSPPMWRDGSDPSGNVLLYISSTKFTLLSLKPKIPSLFWTRVRYLSISELPKITLGDKSASCAVVPKINGTSFMSSLFMATRGTSGTTVLSTTASAPGKRPFVGNSNRSSIRKSSLPTSLSASPVVLSISCWAQMLPNWFALNIPVQFQSNSCLLHKKLGASSVVGRSAVLRKECPWKQWFLLLVSHVPYQLVLLLPLPALDSLYFTITWFPCKEIPAPREQRQL